MRFDRNRKPYLTLRQMNYKKFILLNYYDTCGAHEKSFARVLSISITKSIGYLYVKFFDYKIIS